MSGNEASLVVPRALHAEVRAAAAEEQREPEDVIGEALERYLSERRWLRRDGAHAKIARGLESLQQGRGADGEAIMADLLAELDALEHSRLA